MASKGSQADLGGSERAHMNNLILEISRHTWEQMQCGCNRSAEHIPRDFLDAIRGPLPERIGEGWADNHAYIQSNLMQPAAATASIVAAAIAEPEVPVQWRPQLLAVLANLVQGEQDDISENCKQSVRGCSENLFEEIAAGRSIMAAGYAFELLMDYPDLKERLHFYQVKARENLPADLRAEILNLDSL